mmetsp:Transcript_13218/g.21698  ORF Transcript_13218/g.21698 Transcript_13218/m.21698 type:complete len:191 (+) Transcript_13218:171-743(+)
MVSIQTTVVTVPLQLQWATVAVHHAWHTTVLVLSVLIHFINEFFLATHDMVAFLALFRFVPDLTSVALCHFLTCTTTRDILTVVNIITFLFLGRGSPSVSFFDALFLGRMSSCCFSFSFLGGAIVWCVAAKVGSDKTGVGAFRSPPEANREDWDFWPVVMYMFRRGSSWALFSVVLFPSDIWGRQGCKEI